MPAYGFLVEFEAQEGKEDDVAKFLVDAKTLVDAEPDTLTWFAFQTGPRSFRIFDAFETEEGRDAHRRGKVREAIVARRNDLFSEPPTVTPVDVVAAKLPV
jgi:quinol monooxygenase YgiN